MLARWRAARDEYFASGNDPGHYDHLHSTNVIVVTRSSDHLLVCVRAVVSLCLFAVPVASESWWVCGVRAWLVVILFSLYLLLFYYKSRHLQHTSARQPLSFCTWSSEPHRRFAPRVHEAAATRTSYVTVHTCTMRVEKVCKVREEPAPRFTAERDALGPHCWPHPRPGTFGRFPKHSAGPRSSATSPSRSASSVTRTSSKCSGRTAWCLTPRQAWSSAVNARPLTGMHTAILC